MGDLKYTPAPELLQALEHVTHHLENAMSTNREFDATGARLDIKAAKEAIKKAKGKKNDS